MEQGSRSDQKRKIPPYGPVKGMVEGLQLLQRLSPTVVDEALLRSNKVAPNNEYKVMGALRFLDLIDDEGRPTDKSRLLKTRGPTYMLYLQDIVREAYGELFKQINLRDASKDRIHNFFVTEAKMGSEMAVKATRFFLELCRLAGFDMGASLQGGRRTREPGPRPVTARARRLPAVAEAPAQDRRVAMPTLSLGMPLVFAVSPEIARMEEPDLEQLFRRMLRAWNRALANGLE